MSGRRRAGRPARFILAPLAAAAVLAATALFVGGSELEVRVVASPSGRILWRRPVSGDGRIELRYEHSVERTPVIELFRAEPDGLWFVEVRFVSQGAGLPTEGYLREGNWFVLRRERRAGILPLRVSSVSGHRLRVEGVDLDLVALAGDGASIGVTSSNARRWRWPGTR